MKNPPRKVIKYWVAWEVEAICKSDFFGALDEYILGKDDPEFECIELTALERKDVIVIDDFFNKNIVNLKYEAPEEYTFSIIVEAFKEGLLSEQNASDALVRYFLNDEWGLIETPSERIDDLYHKWVSGEVTYSDKQYFDNLRSELAGHS